MTHPRFNRNVWLSRDSLTANLAKWLVFQSPYVAPDQLAVCLEKFHAVLPEHFTFDSWNFCEVSLLDLTRRITSILESIPEIMALNEPKNPGVPDIVFSSRYSARPAADDDFICIGALAQNITCEYATEADSRDWLDASYPVMYNDQKSTLEQQLKATLEGAFGPFRPDYRVAVQEVSEKGVRVIVHPLGYSGDTLDFIVKGNVLVEAFPDSLSEVAHD